MANKMNTALENLKKEGAIRVYTGMTVVWPQFGSVESLNVSELAPKFNGRYATNNSTACFVTEEGEVYAMPYTRSAMSTLRAAGFCDDYFYVPFSNGDYPQAEAQKWNHLRERARQSYRDDFVSDCKEYCDKHYIGSLSDETLANCFAIPVTGVPVKHLYYEETVYPATNSTCLDCTVVDRLGTFCTNNGRVVFIYRDGTTYVTKGYWILSELRAAGYREAGIFVPFSNGEVIQDPYLKSQWDAIHK